MTQLTLTADARSDPGQAHRLNQDSVLAVLRPPQNASTTGLFVVADGMGGHQAGEIASQLAVETLHEQLAWLLEQPETEATIMGAAAPASEEEAAVQLARRLEAAVAEANRRIFSYAQENPAHAGNLGTTLTGLLIADGLAAVANVGDSRTYVCRNGTLVQITDDHSYIASLVRQGQIEPEAVYTHPRRNVITRSLGNGERVAVDTWVLSVEAGDRFLLCSDGLWEMVHGTETLTRFLTLEEAPAETVTKLIEAANAAGGRDNIGAVVVDVKGRK
ncbi:MAG: protein phosphatase 2C domain-containing protein [Anaerolineae bacterium]|nr:protein phosphatase 2C domain-containing protein [Anaerolineae bacterium]